MDTRPEEGDNYTVHIRPDDWLGFMRGHWYTDPVPGPALTYQIPGPAIRSVFPDAATPGDDYVDLQGLYQEGNRQLVGEFPTIEDEYPEELESFTIRFVNAVEGGEDVECSIYIGDDDYGVVAAGIQNSPWDGEAFRLGEVITFALDFNHGIRVNGMPKVEFRIGDGDNSLRTAPLYHAAYGSESVYFRYRVQPRDLDLDGISMDGGYVDEDGVTRGLIEGSVSDAEDRFDSSPWFRGFDDLPNRKVDGRVYATATEIVSTPANGDTYGVGENIEIALTYTNPVQVEGDVLVNLRLGTGAWWRGAAYSRGSGTDTLVFSYTVQPGDLDTDGISLDGSYVDPDGVAQGYGGDGVIKVVGWNVQAHHYYPYLPHDPAHKVDGRLIATATEIVSTPASGETYGVGENIDIALSYSVPVEVEGHVLVGLRLGAGSWWRGATYNRGSGTNTLVFSYQVQVGDFDDDGISLDGGYIDENGVRHGYGGDGTIRAVGADVGLHHYYPYLHHDSAHKVDGRLIATATEIVSTPASGDTYGIGENIDIALTYANPVEVEGNVLVSLRMGTGSWWRGAAYNRGSGTNTLIFSYQVQAGDLDADGISLDGSYVDAQGVPQGYGGDGALKLAGTDVDMHYHYPYLPHDPAHKVDGVAPSIRSVSITNKAGDDGTYVVEDIIEVFVSFDDDVLVLGAPQMTLDFDGTSKTAGYHPPPEACHPFTGEYSPIPKPFAVFTYTVQAGDGDADGIAISADSITLNGGSIQDRAGNDAILTHAALADDGAHKLGFPHFQAA